jgi:hypothetical protein
MKKLIFLGACLVALASQPVKAQTGVVPSVAVVSIWYPGGGGLPYLQIDRDGIIERKTGLGLGIGEKITGDAVEARAKALRQTVIKLYQEGYVLKASLGHKEVDELIFVKEK